MTEWDLALPHDPVQFVAKFAQNQGLNAKESTLATLKGSVHWHLKKPDSKGVLELTWHPKSERFWASCHGNRQGDWVEPMLEVLRQGVEHKDEISEG